MESVSARQVVAFSIADFIFNLLSSQVCAVALINIVRYYFL